MRLLIVSSAIAFAAVTGFAQEPSSTATVRREVFAEHSAINLVNTIVRTKRGGQDGVLIIGAGEEVSMSCFVPFGGSASSGPGAVGRPACGCGPVSFLSVSPWTGNRDAVRLVD